MLPYDKTLSFAYNNKRNHVSFTQFNKNGLSELIKQVYLLHPEYYYMAFRQYS